MTDNRIFVTKVMRDLDTDQLYMLMEPDMLTKLHINENSFLVWTLNQDNTITLARTDIKPTL